MNLSVGKLSMMDRIASNFPSSTNFWLEKLQSGTHGNRVCVSDDSDATSNMILSHIRQATKRVWIETYIFDGSDHARRFVDELLNAKKRGCDVLLIMDWVGSFDMKSEWVDELRGAGIDVVFFNPLLPRVVGPFGMRDHRKIMIIDETGYCGSMNIMHEAQAPDKGGFFLDIHARLEGPCVVDMANVVLETLDASHSGVNRIPIPPIEPICSCVIPFWSTHLATQLNHEDKVGHKTLFPLSLDRKLVLDEETPISGGHTSTLCEKCIDDSVFVQVLVSDVMSGKREIQSVYCDAVSSAKQRVNIATAYFHPASAIRRSLLKAQSSAGVKIELLLSGGSDVPGDIWATEHVLREYVRRGVRAWRTQDVHMHAKAMVIDSQIGLLGSFNLDRLSFRRNLESMVLFNSKQVASTLESMIDRRKIPGRSEEVTMQYFSSKSWVERLTSFAAALVVKGSATNFFDGLSNNGRRVLLLHFLVDTQAANHIASSMAFGLC